METGLPQAVIRLAGALLLEQNDEWLVQRRYLSAESTALVLTEPSDPTNDIEEVARLTSIRHEAEVGVAGPRIWGCVMVSV